jgi:molybdate transport repressor ModE-like protein
MRLVPEVGWRVASRNPTPLDPRVIRLLGAVRVHATLRAAAAEVGLSYRAAWSLVGDIGRLLGVPVVELRRGRGARLTPAGEQLLAADARAAQRLREAGLEVDLAPRGARAAGPAQPAPTIAASHDLLLAAFCDRWARPEGLVGELAFKGSLESLSALARGEAQVAGFHVATRMDAADTDALRKLLDPRRDALLRFAERDQGLIVPKGNPKGLRSLADVAAKHVRFLNRQRGSGTRLLIDQLLRQEQVDPATIRGYGMEEFTHLAVAATVAAGRADAGFGLRAAAARFKLDFVPLRRETYWLALRSSRLETEWGRRLRGGLVGEPLRRAARGLPGYSIADGGEMVPVAAAFA